MPARSRGQRARHWPTRPDSPRLPSPSLTLLLLLALALPTARSHAVPRPTLSYNDLRRGTELERALLRERQLPVINQAWPGWATATSYTTIYVTGPVPGTETAIGVRPAAPTIETVTETVYPEGFTPTETVPGTTTVTVYAGQPVPSVVTTTVTIFPDGVTPAPTPVPAPGPTRVTTTRTSTSIRPGQTPVPDQQQAIDPNRECEPGDADEQEPGRAQLRPTHTQAVTLYVIAVYFVVMLVAWNLFLVRHLIYPVKLCIVAWHELGHAAGIVLSGRHIESATIDPNEGGMVTPVGGIHAYPLPALPWGFIFSILIGGALTFCGFDTMASKVASFFVGISLAAVIWFGRGLATKLLCVIAIGLLIGFWFIDHASALRFFVLFFGVASSFYVIWDTMDDYVFRKPNPSCAALHNRNIPRVSSATFAGVWLIVSVLVFIGWVLAAIAVFRQTPHGMYCQSQGFLPT